MSTNNSINAAYIEDNLTTHFNWSANSSNIITIKITKIGRQVTLLIPQFLFAATANATITINDNLNASYIPAATITWNVWMSLNGVINAIRLQVTSGGVIQILSSSGGNINTTNPASDVYAITYSV